MDNKKEGRIEITEVSILSDGTHGIGFSIIAPIKEYIIITTPLKFKGPHKLRYSEHQLAHEIYYVFETFGKNVLLGKPLFQGCFIKPSSHQERSELLSLILEQNNIKEIK